jgi:tryptophan-rich sensory protein
MAIVSLQSSQQGTPRPASFLGISIIVGIVAAIELLSAAVGASGVTTYPNVPIPEWTPPGWVFGSVWNALFALMAVAASVVWLFRNEDDVCCPLTAFAIQLGLNLAWNVLFFGLQNPLLGFLAICLLWITAGVTVAQFFLVSRLAGWLMVPYWAWVTFVAALNASILLLGG